MALLVARLPAPVVIAPDPQHRHFISARAKPRERLLELGADQRADVVTVEVENSRLGEGRCRV